jgi:histidinol-phosphatase (PHP family)
MEDSCRRALDIGLPAIAFTEHADFVQVHEGQRSVDMAGYLEAVERCRSAFPNLRILSGVELGEPHWFPAEVTSTLAVGQLDRVLGSVHCTRVQGLIRDASQVRDVEAMPGFMHTFLQETLALVESSQPFQLLAHLDYPKRYWAHDQLEYRETEYEEELRAVLRSLARRGGVLEVNTTRGMEPARGLCPGAQVLGWWHELGGDAVSFGSDAHDPTTVAAGFGLAAQLVEAAGFRPAADPTGFWRR